MLWRRHSLPSALSSLRAAVVLFGRRLSAWGEMADEHLRAASPSGNSLQTVIARVEGLDLQFEQLATSLRRVKTDGTSAVEDLEARMLGRITALETALAESNSKVDANTTQVGTLSDERDAHATRIATLELNMYNFEGKCRSTIGNVFQAYRDDFHSAMLEVASNVNDVQRRSDSIRQVALRSEAHSEEAVAAAEAAQARANRTEVSFRGLTALVGRNSEVMAAFQQDLVWLREAILHAGQFGLTASEVLARFRASDDAAAAARACMAAWSLCAGKAHRLDCRLQEKTVKVLSSGPSLRLLFGSWYHALIRNNWDEHREFVLGRIEELGEAVADLEHRAAPPGQDVDSDMEYHERCLDVAAAVQEQELRLQSVRCGGCISLIPKLETLMGSVRTCRLRLASAGACASLRAVFVAWIGLHPWGSRTPRRGTPARTDVSDFSQLQAATLAQFDDLQVLRREVMVLARAIGPAPGRAAESFTMGAPVPPDTEPPAATEISTQHRLVDALMQHDQFREWLCRLSDDACTAQLHLLVEHPTFFAKLEEACEGVYAQNSQELFQRFLDDEGRSFLNYIEDLEEQARDRIRNIIDHGLLSMHDIATLQAIKGERTPDGCDAVLLASLRNLATAGEAPTPAAGAADEASSSSASAADGSRGASSSLRGEAGTAHGGPQAASSAEPVSPLQTTDTTPTHT